MSENLKQFKNVVSDALVAYFTERDDKMTYRYVADITTGKPVRTYMDEHLSDMIGEIVLSDATERNGEVTATFVAERGGNEFTFGYTADTTIMNIILEVALAL
jgi:hypothetical protein